MHTVMCCYQCRGVGEWGCLQDASLKLTIHPLSNFEREGDWQLSSFVFLNQHIGVFASSGGVRFEEIEGVVPREVSGSCREELNSGDIHERCKMEPYAGYASFDESIAFVSLRRERSFHDGRFGLDKSIEDAICKIIAESRAEHLSATKPMQILERVKMSTAGTLGGREQVRQEHDIVARVARVDAIVINWGREGAVTT